MAFLDYICAFLARIANLIFHLLPIGFTLWLARRLAIVGYLVNGERRAIGHANLRAAFCGGKSPGELDKLNKKVYQSLAQVLFEILSLTKVNKKYIERYVEIVGTENFYQIENHPHGVIFLTAHLGNWELSATVSALKGYPLVVLAREQSMKRLDSLLNRLRESKGLTVVTKGITTRYIVKSLGEGKIIGMLGDQNAGKTGIFVNFFGRPASTAPGAMRFAAKTGAYILPAFITRIKGPRHKLTIGKPIKIGKGEDITPYLEGYNRELEKYVRIYPDQWLWLHKRWKSSPVKKVIILSDGKAGHLNQSLAVLKELKRYREKAGYTDGDTKVEIIEVKFKNALTKMLLLICGLFSDRNCQGCMRCVKFCLTPDSYDNLMKKYADIVISSGSSTASVNRFFSIENNAKSATIMKPSILGLNKCDMAIVPWHDRIKPKSPHVIITDTTPNLIDAEHMEAASRDISAIAGFADTGVSGGRRRSRIGVLLGGDNSDFVLTRENTEGLLSDIIDASRKLDSDILFTTSRRTPKESENTAKEMLYPEKHARLVVIANEKNVPNAVGGILGLADVVVVSGESASMVSEAISSGKKVVVFKLEKKRKGRSKFDSMLRRLEEKRYITVAEIDSLSEAICRSMRENSAPNIPADRHNIYMHMWRLGV